MNEKIEDDYLWFQNFSSVIVFQICWYESWIEKRMNMCMIFFYQKSYDR